MKKNNKKKFLKLPKYLGGSSEFKKFILENLKYPAEALEKKIEGDVIVQYDITGLGNVQNIKILNKLGYGCDEEAIRLISLLKFEKVVNKGVRLTTTLKTKIKFKLPKTNSQTIEINYVVKKTEEPLKIEEKKTEQITYTYTFNL